MSEKSRMLLSSLPNGGCAVIFGSSGAIGSALENRLKFEKTIERTAGFSRSTSPSVDITVEKSIADAASAVSEFDYPVRLLIDATGFLHDDDTYPEKALAKIDGFKMAYAMAVNAIGPALLMKHFLPLLPKEGKSVFCTLSARVGSIADNRLGGWYSYRSSKAALNQIVRTSAIELKRLRPDALCVAYHPGTVDSPLSDPFLKSRFQAQSAAEAAEGCLSVLDHLTPSQSGGFFDYKGAEVPW